MEKRIRKEFIGKGGKPKLEHPIYFFLGHHSGFEKHESNHGYMIYLKDISEDSISFTYGDSMFTYNKDYQSQLGEKYQNPLCTKVFRLDELEFLISHKDFPKNTPLSIEAQLWIMPPQKIITPICKIKRQGNSILE